MDLILITIKLIYKIEQGTWNSVLFYAEGNRVLSFFVSWEQRKLDDIVDRYDNLRIPVAANLRIKGNTPYYGANGIQDHVKGYTHKGEFILVAEDGANDLKNYPVQYVNGYIWANNHVHVLQAKKEKANNKFIKYAISQTNIESLLVGGGRAKLNANIMMEIELKMPNNLQEQSSIGNIISKIDNLITLHQSKYDKLVNVKKALLEKMFPKDGKNVPEIRFKGFADTWEQRKLGEIANIIMGQSPDGINYTDNPTDNILIQGNADLDNGIVVPRIWTTQITKISKPNDIIFTVRAPVGEVAKNTYTAVIGRGVASISGNDFLYQTLKKMKEFDYWSKLSAGSTFDSINSEQLKNSEINIPLNEEQKQIGNFLEKIDNLITLHQHKLEKLKNMKKSLLNKMFI